MTDPRGPIVRDNSYLRPDRRMGTLPAGRLSRRFWRSFSRSAFFHRGLNRRRTCRWVAQRPSRANRKSTRPASRRMSMEGGAGVPSRIRGAVLFNRRTTSGTMPLPRSRHSFNRISSRDHGRPTDRTTASTSRYRCQDSVERNRTFFSSGTSCMRTGRRWPQTSQARKNASGPKGRLRPLRPSRYSWKRQAGQAQPPFL